MNRSLCTLLGVLGIAFTANGATLSVLSNKITYAIGETITLVISGDDGGASSYGVFGRLDYSGALVDNGTRSQITLNGGVPWIKGVLNSGDNGTTAFSYAFNQIAGLVAQTATNLPGSLSTVTLIAKNAGMVNVNWHTLLDGAELDFFGLTNAPGTTFYIINSGCDGCTPPPLPEPATGLLLGLGLLALAAARRAGDTS